MSLDPRNFYSSMYGIVFSLVIAVAIAQTSRPNAPTSTSRVTSIPTQLASPNLNTTLNSGITPACQAQIDKNSAALQSCGAGFASSIQSGVATSNIFPTLPNADTLNKGLDAFCSTDCANASNSLAQDLFSPTCMPTLSNSPVSSSDITALVKLGREATCVKDGSSYCATTIMTLLGSNPLVGVSSPTAFLQNQTIVCSKCFKLEVDALTNGLNTLSPTLKNAYQPLLKVVTDSQKSCPSNSAFTSRGFELLGVALVSAFL